jgi:hypothetical protein
MDENTILNNGISSGDTSTPSANINSKKRKQRSWIWEYMEKKSIFI